MLWEFGALEIHQEMQAYLSQNIIIIDSAFFVFDDARMRRLRTVQHAESSVKDEQRKKRDQIVDDYLCDYIKKYISRYKDENDMNLYFYAMFSALCQYHPKEYSAPTLAAINVFTASTIFHFQRINYKYIEYHTLACLFVIGTDVPELIDTFVDTYVKTIACQHFSKMTDLFFAAMLMNNRNLVKIILAALSQVKLEKIAKEDIQYFFKQLKKYGEVLDPLIRRNVSLLFFSLIDVPVPDDGHVYLENIILIAQAVALSSHLGEREKSEVYAFSTLGLNACLAKFSSDGGTSIIHAISCLTNHHSATIINLMLPIIKINFFKSLNSFDDKTLYQILTKIISLGPNENKFINEVLSAYQTRNVAENPANVEQPKASGQDNSQLWLFFLLRALKANDYQVRVN
jgi:hypothetical protein